PAPVSVEAEAAGFDAEDAKDPAADAHASGQIQKAQGKRSASRAASNGNDGPVQGTRGQSAGRMPPATTTTADLLWPVQYVVYFHRVAACAMGFMDSRFV